jgi:hypothetical protein
MAFQVEPSGFMVQADEASEIALQLLAERMEPVWAIQCAGEPIAQPEVSRGCCKSITVGSRP